MLLHNLHGRGDNTPNHFHRLWSKITVIRRDTNVPFVIYSPPLMTFLELHHAVLACKSTNKAANKSEPSVNPLINKTKLFPCVNKRRVGGIHVFISILRQESLKSRRVKVQF